MVDFDVTAEQVLWQGALLKAGTETYRYRDGKEKTYEKVWHPGAVAVVPYDQRHVWLVRQPREASRQTALLEIPAGKCDRPNEPLLALAKRELIEETGKLAGSWQMVFEFFPSPGFCDERLTLFAATDLSDVEGGAQPDGDEQIEIVAWPLSDIPAAISSTQDGKTLVALLWLARQLGV
ncbi:MAG: NUDIX hydrolase [Solirubrobacteraceae bacterium]